MKFIGAGCNWYYIRTKNTWTGHVQEMAESSAKEHVIWFSSGGKKFGRPRIR